MLRRKELKRNIIYKFCCKHSFYRTQIARKVRLHEKSDCTLGRLKSRMSFIYKYEISTLTPFVKPRNILNLAVQNVHWIHCYIQSRVNPLFGAGFSPGPFIPAPVWPDVGRKSSPIVTKNYPKSSHISFYVKLRFFEITVKVTQSCGPLLLEILSPRTLKNCPIWSQWSAQTQWRLLEVQTIESTNLKLSQFNVHLWKYWSHTLLMLEEPQKYF